jgi:hypothetical protein
MAERIPSAEREACLRLLLVAILTLGCAARVATFRSPIFDFHSWRQADTAAISRNFVEERFNPLYPQIDWRGNRQHGFVETGLELHAFLVAGIAKAVGFSPAIGRLLNALLFPVAGFLLFRFAQRRYGDTHGLIAAVIYSVGLPLSMFIDRAFMNESLLTLLSIACLYATQEYVVSKQVRHFVILIAASMLIAMVKPTYLIVLAPVAGILCERFGAKTLARWEAWTVGLLAAASAVLWFSHAGNVAQSTGLSFGISNKLFDPAITFSLEYPFVVARRLVKDILGPAGVVFAVIGTVIAIRRGMYAEVLGVAAFVAYLVIVSAGNLAHNYYQLPVVPIATVLTSLGIVTVIDTLARNRKWSWPRQLSMYCAILWIAAVSTLIRNVSAHNWYELNHSRLQLCEALKPLLAADDRLVFVNDQSPDVLFCVDRKGWLLRRDESSADHVRRLAAEGASVVVVHREDGPIAAGITTTPAPLMETTDFVVLRLTAGGSR